MEVDMDITDEIKFKLGPFQVTARADWEDGKLQTEVSFDLPKEMRLIIENISATLECPKEQEITSTQVRTVVNGQIAWHAVSVPKTGTYEKVNLYSGGQLVRVYADPGTTVTVLVHKNSDQCQAPCGTTIVSISGDLLPA